MGDLCWMMCRGLLRDEKAVIIKFLSQSIKNVEFTISEASISEELIAEVLTPDERLKEILRRLKSGDDLASSIDCLQKLLDKSPAFLKGWMELGKLHRRMGDHKQALSAFERAQELAPNQLNPGIEVAIERKVLGQCEAAIEQLRTALTHHPKSFLALFQLALVYKKQQKREKAIEILLQAIAFNSKHFASQLQLATLYRETNQLTLADNQLQQLLKAYPDRPGIYIELGLVRRKQGDRQSAISFFEQAYQQSGSSPQRLTVTCQIATDLRELGQLEAAKDKLAEVLSQSPHHAASLQALATLHQQQDQPSEAILCCQKVIAADPKNVPARLKLSVIWRSRNDYSRAQQSLEDVLSIQENHLDALLNLATLFQQQQQCEQALNYCDQACRAYPEQIRPVLLRADILRCFHRLDEAQAQLESLLKVYPDEPQVSLKLGHLARQKGQRQVALDCFEQAEKLAHNPAQVDTIQLLIVNELRSLNRLDEALINVRALVERSPENVNARVTMASVLREQMDYDAAEQVHRETVAAAPTDIPSQLALANLLSETHRISAAIDLLEELHDQSKQRSFPVMMRLGALHKAEEDWESARYWYQLAKKYYPHKLPVYGALADILYLQGEIDAAIALLMQARERFPDAPEIPLRLANLKLRFGQLDESLKILKGAHQRFPNHPQLIFQLCRQYFQIGQFEQIETLLVMVKIDQSGFLKQVAQLRGDIKLAQFDLNAALQYFQQSVQIAPATIYDHRRLSLIWMLLGDIDSAYAQLVKATEEQQIRKRPGQRGLPISGHVAFLINQLRTNPPLLIKLQNSLTEPAAERLITLGSIVLQEPAYLGAASYLCKELRQQGIFEHISEGLRDRALPPKINTPTIPRRIVQYWDNPQPPEEILTVGRSWCDHNPDYVYERFSFERAVEFLRSHYDADVVQAFEYCDYPATQADLFRLAYLNIMGGFYADADDRALRSLNDLVNSNAELILYQEDNACVANNFIGCVPHHPVIRSALFQAVENLLCYNNEGPWMQTGPGLLTSSLCSHLLPYLSCTDYRTWPKLWVFTPQALRHYVLWGAPLPYKQTLLSWQKATYDGLV